MIDRYDHTQRGPLAPMLYLLALTAAFAAGVSWWMDRPLDAGLMLGVTALVGLGASCCGHLRVSDGGEHLLVRFGPLPLLKRRIAYADIESVVRGRSALIDGLGVHRLPGRGWTYNIWGRDCVEMVVKGARIRVGSDEPDRLVEFLRARIAETGESVGSAIPKPT